MAARNHSFRCASLDRGVPRQDIHLSNASINARPGCGDKRRSNGNRASCCTMPSLLPSRSSQRLSTLTLLKGEHPTNPDHRDAQFFIARMFSKSAKRSARAISGVSCSGRSR